MLLHQGTRRPGSGGGARLGKLTSIDEAHLPWLGMAVMHLRLVVLQIERDVRAMQEIIGEILLTT